MFDVKQELPKAPLYREEFEHDNCGIGACVNIHGEKSRATVENALKIVENLEHRAGKDAEGKTGDGVGILTQIPHKFLQESQRLWAWISAERENTVSACSSSPRKSCVATRRRRCLRSLWKRKEWNSSAGVKCPLSPMCWDIRQ